MDLSKFRPNVGLVLFRGDGKVWLGRRAGAPGPDNWQFPQGGVDRGESLEQAALRELREETGVASARLVGRTRDWLAYAFPPGHARRKTAQGWLGQKQIWFAALLTGPESEIDVSAHGEVEFDAWRWEDLARAADHVVPFKRDTYGKVIAAFARFARGGIDPDAPLVVL